MGALVPVHAVWQREVGPMLSLGMLTAAARTHRDGALAAHYEIHRPQLRDAVLADLATGSGPAVLLASNYVWSLDHNLEVAAAARAIRPDLIVVHGGPSTPKYHGDIEEFLRRHRDVAQVLVHGEGEATLCAVLDALATAGCVMDHGALAGVAGISYLHPGTGEVVHTEDRPRLADLDTLPSPYLTGEFDDIDPADWVFCAPIETNRGCPYGCTFCDWGSATLARIRKFGMDRITAEIEWCAERGILGVQLCDANFGIMRRDVEVAQALASARRRHHWPELVAFTPAKNTSRHLTSIFDELLGAGIALSTAISLQTTDPKTLDLVARSNISTDAYLALAADLRRRGQPLQGDVLLGMPGQTYESYRTDLQFFMDHDIMPRTWNLRLLPNAPMNDPAYRTEHEIRVDEHHLVVATSSMSEADRGRMQLLRRAQVIAWRYGALRHVMHVAQWDHGVAATEVLEALVAAATTAPAEFPALSWVFEYFDLFQVPPLGWSAFYADVRRLLRDRLGIEASSGIETAIAVQLAVMPAPGRTFPATIDLAHDYPAYLQDATRSLYDTGSDGRPSRPLADHPPSTLVVTGDPEEVCTIGTRLRGDARSPIIQGDFWIVTWLRYELPTNPPIPAAATPLPVEVPVTVGASA